ncbi:MAG: uroporphyrinogen-III C-methyltransferase [Thermoplasmata archaeon]
MAGKVYLIGAGPGDPDLLTIKAMKIIKKSDIILYDRLIEKSILKKIPKATKKIFVGKNLGEDSDALQNKINELIEKYYFEGKVVARLKSGDPFIFGRGGEEIEFMKNKNIDFEVIPGITSATGVPTYMGLPLTHRNYSSSILIIPGHFKNGNTMDWELIARFDGTLVILMGVSNMDEIMKNLILHGKDENTPVCIIQNGTKSNQKILKGNIKNIADMSRKRKVKPPAVIVIGKVVHLLD